MDGSEINDAVDHQRADRPADAMRRLSRHIGVCIGGLDEMINGEKLR